jgi:4-methylaminobutanoate oxidase (formaldehyde-forming)
MDKFKNEKPKIRFSMFTLKESKPGEPLLLHDEPIYMKDKIIGRTTSANYSFNYKKNLAFGYIKNEFSNSELQSNKLYIEVEKKKFEAELLLKPLKKSRYKEI